MLFRILVFFVGLFISCLGAAMCIQANLGVGSWGVFFIGIHQHIPWLSIGICSIITQFFAMFLEGLIRKQVPNLFSVAIIFLRGLLLDAAIWLTNLVVIYNSFEMHLLYLFLGVLLLGGGIGIYIHAKFPKAPFDSLMMAVHETYRLPIWKAQALVECFAVFCGVLLSGPLGWGTVLISGLLGFVIDGTHRLTKKPFLFSLQRLSYSK